MTILLFSKEDLHLSTLEFRFRKVGWVLRRAAELERLQELIDTCHPDALILDFEPGSDEGLSILEVVRLHHGNRLPILVSTEWEDLDNAQRALQQGAVDFIPKPWRPEEIILRVRKAVLERRQGAR